MGNLVRFVKNCPPYVIGDVAGFADQTEVTRLLQNKVAVPYSEAREELNREVKEPEFDRQMKPKRMTFNRRPRNNKK